jgi:hypothetical protein
LRSRVIFVFEWFGYSKKKVHSMLKKTVSRYPSGEKGLPPKNAGVRGELSPSPPPFYNPAVRRAALNHDTLCRSAEAQHPGGPREVDPFWDKRVIIDQ